MKKEQILLNLTTDSVASFALELVGILADGATKPFVTGYLSHEDNGTVLLNPEKIYATELEAKTAVESGAPCEEIYCPIALPCNHREEVE